MTGSRLQTLIKGRDVVFITVKNKEYIRVVQIEKMLKDYAGKYRVITSEKGNPISRTLDIKRRIKALDFSKTDVVIAGFLPQLIWSELYKKGKNENGNISFIGEVFLSLYDTVALDRKYVSEGSIVAALMKKLDKRVLDEAELIVTDTKADAEFFSTIYGINSDKFETLYLDAGELCRVDGGKEYNRTEITRVLYFGTGLPLQGTDIVLKAFNEVAQKEVFECIYIGSTKKVPAKLLKSVKENKNITLIDWLDQKELFEVIKNADICLAGHFNSEIDKADRTIPGKAYIYETMGKIMILGDTRANHEIFIEDDDHLFVKRGDAKALEECIFKAAHM
ncbi:glycosyltransferase [Butyrivibrio sp. AE2015]|uniref:glycosyltransferase n=1 Tax=Butyrivibrio sp. AE2015 TaxID=1280663 RepID=UPI0018CB9273|nr:glycosyltransferase [Butyrivibrio sp. AE2015]